MFLFGVIMFPLPLSTDKEFYINWKSNDLSHEDVASLFSAEADGWAMIDEIGGHGL